MSIYSYLKAWINGNTGSATSILYGQYVAKIGAKRKDGKIVMRQIEFGMAGPSATGNVADLDEAASIMAGRIAKLSEGVLFGLFKQLGKYRNDEAPTELACKATQWGKIIVSNDPRVEDEDAAGPYPLKQYSTSVFIPWLDDETSRQDMKNTVKAPVTVGAVDYNLAASRFSNTDKTAIEVFPMQYVQGVQTKCYNTVAGFDLVNADSDEGFGSDGILSEGNTPIVSGSDDQGL